MIVTETQNKIPGRKVIVRTYHLVGPGRDIVESFWNWLVKKGTIQSFEISDSDAPR